MSRGVNKAILLGNVGKDADVKYTQGGMAIARFSLATTSTRKDRDGNRVEETQWHNVKAFGRLAEIAGEYVRKGRQLYVEGTIRYEKSETDNSTRYFTDIIADNIQLLGPNDGERGGGSRPAARTGGRDASPARTPTPRDDFESDFADDDIPF